MVHPSNLLQRARLNVSPAIGKGVSISSSNRQKSKLSRKRMLQIGSLDDWVPSYCCRRLCSEHIGTEHCRNLHGLFLGLRRDERKKELCDIVKSVGDSGEGQRVVINHVGVCNRFLVETIGVSRTLTSNVLGLPSANASRFAGRNGGTEGSYSKKSGITSFIRILADAMCDEIPHKNERHLPHGNKRLVYLLYKHNEHRYARQPSQESFFYRVWKQFMPHVKCLRRHCFTACDTCVMFKEKLQDMARVPSRDREREVLRNQFNQHLKLVQLERAEYRHIQTLAAEKPKDYLPVIIDGADQAKFGLPRFPQATKRETGRALKQKVTGIVFHEGLSRQDFVSFLTSPENLLAGANQTIDAFSRALFVLMEKRSVIGMPFLPPELFFNSTILVKITRTDTSWLFAIFLSTKAYSDE